MPTMRIFLNGYYGFANLGDEALLWTLLRAIQRHSGESCEFLIRSARPLLLPPELSGQCRRVGNQPAELIAAAHRSDLTVFGGGSQFQDNGRLSFLRFFLKPWAIALAAQHLAAIGISIGPLATWPGKKLAHGLLRKMDSILTRDETSYRLAETLGCRVENGPDICYAGYLNQPVNSSAVEAPPCLGLSLLPRSLLVKGNGAEDQAWLLIWQEALGLLAEQKPDLQFLGAPFQRGIDNVPIAQTLARIPEQRHALAPLDQGPEQALIELNRCTHFVTMRFHALVFASLLGKPALILDYHPKVRLLAAELGYPKASILSPDQWRDRKVVARSLARLMDSPEQFMPSVNIQEFCQLARRQLDRTLVTTLGRI
jgi:polysaccharide pyruvyl transferase WcaK-like protein